MYQPSRKQLFLGLWGSLSSQLKPPYSMVHSKFQPFRTFPFGFVFSNLHIRDLKTYPQIYFSHFWNMSLYNNSRAIWVLLREKRSSQWRSDDYPFVLGGHVYRPHCGPFWIGHVPHLVRHCRLLNIEYHPGMPTVAGKHTLGNSGCQIN